MSFVHLHTHSEYSLLDGANRIPELVGHVKKLGMDSLAVTDHGNMHAAWSFYEEAKAQQIRPILGFEAYLAYRAAAGAGEAVVGARGVQPSGAAGPEPRRLPQPGPAHLDRLHRGLLPAAADRQGGARGALRGLVCLAACLSGEVALHLRQGRYEEARKSAEWFARTFGTDGFWLEIQQHGIGDERIVADGMLRLGQELGLGVVATNDAHYLRREDAEAHDVLLAIGTGSDLDDPKRFRFTGQESYVKSEKEMRALFPDQPEALANTQRVADLCEFDFEKRYFLPGFPRPAGYATDEALLDHLAREGAARRYGSPLPAPVVRAAGVRARGDRDRRATPATSSSSRTSSPRRGTAASPSARAAAPPPARSWRTRSASPTSARSSSTCCSSGSSIPSGCRCPTSTWTSASSAGAK